MAQRSRKGKRPAPVPARRAAAPVAVESRPGWRHAPAPLLAVAALAVLAFYVSLRARAAQPWSYDEYYHLGIARQMWSDVRIESFRWTPFSIFFDHFADKEPLFHVLLMPFAGLPLERAGLFGTILGQIFVVGVFAWILWRLRVPRAPLFLLALTALGPMFALRAEMCRPHIWLIGFSLLVLGLLATNASWKVLLPVCALFGLAHTGGWIAIPFAAVWSVAGLLSQAPEERPLDWRPLGAAAGGWLLGQLIHPNVPENFRLFWLQNFVVPYQSTAGSAALRSQIGNELTPPEGMVLLEQLPAFVAPLLVVWLLLFRERLRTRATITAAVFGLAFLVIGSFFLRRFFELGAPLSLLALALAVRDRHADEPVRHRSKAWPIAAAVAILLGAAWTWLLTGAYGFGATSPPRAVAEWLGERGTEGERVFTAQWADSAPLFYAAPQLQSLVVLDPTFFLAKDPELFETYVRIVQGRHPEPARAIRERFGARWVTIWKQPAYQTLASQLGRTPGVIVPFNTDDYMVFDLRSTGI
ncbi:MAG TPA: hypothetical protein VKM72_35025 [Thermoanaerobaculia bacterium]|nr:hypothetical protein [Thermoanaerobaculia bacterium]